MVKEKPKKEKKLEVKAKAELEAKLKADAEEKVRLEAEAKVKAEKEVEAKAKAEAAEKARLEAEAKAQEAPKPIAPRLTIAELQRLEKTDKKEYARVIKQMAAARLAELEARINSSTQYPQETDQKFRLERKAIEKGIWRPGWSLPRKKSAVERFLDS